MVEVAVIGSEDFILGFRLAGIKEAIVATGNTMADLRQTAQKKNIGIVVVEQDMLATLDAIERQEIENSVDPVFIPLSTQAEQESLKRLIKKSIGIDLWS